MSHHLAQLVAARGELGPRLVYADAQSELGDPFGEYLALSCALLTAKAPQAFALATRAQALWREHQARWLKTWGADHVYALRMRAGFPESVELRAEPAWPQFTQLLATCPIRELAVRDVASKPLKRMLGVPGIERVEQLFVWYLKTSKAVLEAFASANWAGLESFTLEGQWSVDDQARFLQAMPRLTSVRTVELEALAQWPGVTALRHWSTSKVELADSRLSAMRLTSLSAAQVLAGSAMPSVTSVGGGVSFASPRVLECFPSVRELNLAAVNEPCDEATLDELAASFVWPSLEVFAFAAPEPTVARLAQLVRARCGQLRQLRVRNSSALVDWVSACPSLESLSVDGRPMRRHPTARLDDAALTTLAPALGAGLRSLELMGDFTVEGLRALIANPALRLERVLLGSPSFNAQCVEVLCEMPTLTHLEWHHGDLQSLYALEGAPSQGRSLRPTRMAGPPQRGVWAHEVQ